MTLILQEKIEAQDLWELDRVVDRASMALRCPPRDAEIAPLSGGEKRRVALGLIAAAALMALDDELDDNGSYSLTFDEFKTWLQGSEADFEKQLTDEW